MLIYQTAVRRFAGRLLCLLTLLSGLTSFTSAAEAQERRYLFELGAAGAFQSYNNDTNLDGSFGGLGRLGLWLPLNLSVELEGSLAKSNDIGVKVGSASLLYNLLLGSRSWGYVKAGIGGTRYGAASEICQTDAKYVGKICGTTTTLVAGLGVRIPLSPMLFFRTEAVINP